MSLQRLDRAAPIEEMLDAFDTDGGLIVESMFEKPTIAAMREAIVEAAPGYEPGSDRKSVV